MELIISFAVYNMFSIYLIKYSDYEVYTAENGPCVKSIFANTWWPGKKIPVMNELNGKQDDDQNKLSSNRFWNYSGNGWKIVEK